eukprot:SM000026S08985  [mRNA]  locus=s26:790608:792519:- [translate_table: standard]
MYLACLRRRYWACAAALAGRGPAPSLAVLVHRAWDRRLQLLYALGPLAAVIASFAAFVYSNGGIVVGAKDAHRPAPHLAQPFYFAAFAAGAMAPVHFHPQRAVGLLAKLRKQLTTSPLATSAVAALAVVLSFIAVHSYSLAHPYLLADNRHYTFYLWKDVIQRHSAAKYLLIPLYLYCAYSLADKAVEQMGGLQAAAFTGAVVAVLAPAPLVELRYFTVPFFILMLHTPELGSAASLAFLLPLYSAVNITILYVFLWRPFEWPHEPGIKQRFMW